MLIAFKTIQFFVEVKMVIVVTFCKLEFRSTLIFADEQLIRRDIISWQSLVCFIQYPVVGGLTPS